MCYAMLRKYTRTIKEDSDRENMKATEGIKKNKDTEDNNNKNDVKRIPQRNIFDLSQHNYWLLGKTLVN